MCAKHVHTSRPIPTTMVVSVSRADPSQTESSRAHLSHPTRHHHRRHHCVRVLVFGCSGSDITVFAFGQLFAEHVFVFVPLLDLNECSCSVNAVRSQPWLLGFIYPVQAVTSCIMMCLIISLSIDYAIFLLARFQEDRDVHIASLFVEP